MRAAAQAPTTPLEMLLLCDYQKQIGATVNHHIDALVGMSRHRVRSLSIMGDLPPGLDLDRFDVIFVHYSLVASMEEDVSSATRARLRAARAIKALFIQDEQRFVDRSIGAFRELGLDVLFTNLPESEYGKLYPPEKLPGVHKATVLTGYVEESLVRHQVPPLDARPIDVGYRSRRVPVWLGEAGQEKWRIGVRFAEEAPAHGLVCDMSLREEERLYGEAWIAFMTRCKAVLGVETGSTVCDITGDIERSVARDLHENPGISYEELRARHFGHCEGRVDLTQISPRCFEAAALRTLMILYEGRYSGLLEPWRHYVPLKKDHSNMAEVAAVLRDPDRSAEIVDRAYREVACSPRNSFRSFAEHVDAVIERCVAPAHRASKPAYGEAEFRRASTATFSTLRRRAKRNLTFLVYQLLFRRMLGWLSEERRDAVHGRLRRLSVSLRGGAG